MTARRPFAWPKHVSSPRPAPTSRRRSCPSPAARCSAPTIAGSSPPAASSCGCGPGPRRWPARVGDGVGRPLLGEDPATALTDLLAVRSPLYAELADVILDVDDLAPAVVAERIIDAVDASAEVSPELDTAPPHTPVTRPRAKLASSRPEPAVHALSVDLAERSYPVLVGPGARHEVARFVPSAAKAAVLVTQQSIKDAGWVDDIDPGVPFEVCLIPDGEHAKTLATVETLTRFFAGAGLSRADVVVAVGGGIVTDVAGFAAATYHRGTAVRERRHSLLGQVDAAIGGKTGVNLPEGKNLVGALLAAGRRPLRHRDPRTLPPASAAVAGARWPSTPSWASTASVDLPDRRAGGPCAASRPPSSATTSAKAAVGPCSTTATPWRTPSRRGPPTTLVRPAPRRGGGDRAAVRRPPGAAARADQRRPGGRARPDHRRLRPADRPPGRRRRGGARRLSWDGTRRRTQDLTFVLDGPNGVEAVRGVATADVVATLAGMGARG